MAAMYIVVAILSIADMVCLVQSILPLAGNEFRCYEAKIVEECWRLKPEVSWARLTVTAGLFTFLYFTS